MLQPVVDGYLQVGHLRPETLHLAIHQRELTAEVSNVIGARLIHLAFPACRES